MRDEHRQLLCSVLPEKVVDNLVYCDIEDPAETEDQELLDDIFNCGFDAADDTVLMFGVDDRHFEYVHSVGYDPKKKELRVFTVQGQEHLGEFYFTEPVDPERFKVYKEI